MVVEFFFFFFLSAFSSFIVVFHSSLLLFLRLPSGCQVLVVGRPPLDTHREKELEREIEKEREREDVASFVFPSLSLSLSLFSTDFFPFYGRLSRERGRGGRRFRSETKTRRERKIRFFSLFLFFFLFRLDEGETDGGENEPRRGNISYHTRTHTHKTLENDEPFRRRVPPPPPRKIPPEQKENVAERKHKNGRRPGTRSRNGPATRTRPNPTVFRDRESQPDRRRNNRPERLEQSGVAANGGAPLAGRRRRHLAPSSDRTDNYVTTSFLFSSPFRPLSNNVSPDPNRNERVSIQTSGWKRSFFVFVSCFLFFSSQRNVAIRYDARTADDGGRCRHV